MKRLALAAALLVAGVAAAGAADRVKLGTLTCDVAGGPGVLFASSKQMDCVFRSNGRSERYDGRISRLGLDLGATQHGKFGWIVFAATRKVPRGALAGSYGGIGAEATIGLGVSANAMIGGFDRQIMLQPFSGGAQRGLNGAIGLAGLRLTQH